MGNSKCDVLSVLDLKDAFHSLSLSENSKKYCGILPYFCLITIPELLMGLNISPPIWQLYLNTILDCLESRKYCEVIMRLSAVIHTLKAISHDKTEDVLKVLLKNGLKISPKRPII